MPALIWSPMTHLGLAKVAGKPSVQTGVIPGLITLAIEEHQPNSVFLDRHIIPLTDFDYGRGQQISCCLLTFEPLFRGLYQFYATYTRFLLGYFVLTVNICSANVNYSLNQVYIVPGKGYQLR